MPPQVPAPIAAQAPPTGQVSAQASSHSQYSAPAGHGHFVCTCDSDCGFTTGARFVLIKLISGAGNWYLYDSVRGIGSGNDPFLKLNATGAQTTNSDYIDIDASGAGFKINSGSSFLNISGGTYIFLAIA